MSPSNPTDVSDATIAALKADERKAIASLKRLAQRWPQSLWLFSASGSLCVMRADANGEKVHVSNGGFDASRVVETITNIPNDGGDW